MDESGNTKDDLGLPKGTDDAEKLASQIQDDFGAGKELVVTVLKVCVSLAPMPPFLQLCAAHQSFKLPPWLGSSLSKLLLDIDDTVRSRLPPGLVRV